MPLPNANHTKMKLKYIYHTICATMIMLAATFHLKAQNRYIPPASATQTDSIMVSDTLRLPWTTNISLQIDSLLRDNYFRYVQAGIMIFDLDADSVIYSHDSQKLLRPASTMKLLTAVTSIGRLGMDYRFGTTLTHTGAIEGRTLKGDLYCVGGMDPAFDGNDMQSFIQSVKGLGIDTIQGNIYADVSMKDTLHWGKGWCWDDQNPSLRPLLYKRRDIFIPEFVKGLSTVGITHLGMTGKSKSPNNAQTLCHRSHTMDQILKRMLKESDNLYAESMFYQVARVGTSGVATAKVAAAEIAKVLEKCGVSSNEFRIADGSGLSLYNYCTANLLVRLLRHAYHDRTIHAYLYPALPIGGIDGTLKGRMHDPSCQGNIHAKTGTLTGVCSLAGYATAGNGHKLCWAIINQGSLKAKQAKAFQDRVCEILCKTQ